VRDELNEGDQILVKVLALEGNKIKLSRKAILREQREKLNKAQGGTPAEESAEPQIEVRSENRGPRPEGAPATDRPPRSDRGDRPHRSGDRDRGPRRGPGGR